MGSYESVLKFWFEELTPKQWFVKDDDLDNEITSRFLQTLAKAAVGECFHWRQSTSGRLAEIIVLDQFSRNIYRDTAKAFAQDAIALVLAQEMVHLSLDKTIVPNQRRFIYMPYMHSESSLIHEQALQLFSQPELESNYEFEVKHKEIIDQYGRYPHRNKILGRASTPEEREFLKQPGSGF